MAKDKAMTMKYVNMLDYPKEVFEGIDYLTCVEAGSRAWGFASPDSDFDIRFVYQHRKKSKYLELDDPTDVLEFQYKPDNIDGSGWDLKKALKLARKSNVSLYEWIYSPINYGNGGSFRTAFEISMKDYIDTTFCKAEMAYHYRGIAVSTYKQHLAGTGEKTMKKYLYVVRCLLATSHLLVGNSRPPVLFEHLYRTAPLLHSFGAGEIIERVQDLVRIKVEQSEKAKLDQDSEEFWVQWIANSLNVVTNEALNSIPRISPDTERLNKIYQMHVKG